MVGRNQRLSLLSPESQANRRWPLRQQGPSTRHVTKSGFVHTVGATNCGRTSLKNAASQSGSAATDQGVVASSVAQEHLSLIIRNPSPHRLQPAVRSRLSSSHHGPTHHQRRLIGDAPEAEEHVGAALVFQSPRTQSPASGTARWNLGKDQARHHMQFGSK